MHCVMIENYTEATERRPMDAGEGCARGGYLLSAYFFIPQPLSRSYQPAQTSPY
jgi:hypothetical protein